MARTLIRGGAFFVDGTVQRDDLDTTTAGQALIRKLIAGTGISLSSTGADAGTGDVTVNISTVPPANGGVATGAIQAFAGLSANLPSGWLLCDGSSVARATYATLFAALSASATVTITIAAPGVVTWNAHGLANGSPINIATTGALPTGLTAGTTYYAVNVATNTFQLAATVGGAAITTTGTQSGVHTAYFVPHGATSTTTFNLPDLRGRTIAGQDNMGGTAANRLTSGGSGILGTVLGNAGGAETNTLTTAQLAVHSHTYGSATSGGSGTGNPGVGTGTNSTSSNAGSGTAHNNTQPTLILNYIIKT